MKTSRVIFLLAIAMVFCFVQESAAQGKGKNHHSRSNKHHTKHNHVKERHEHSLRYDYDRHRDHTHHDHHRDRHSVTHVVVHYPEHLHHHSAHCGHHVVRRRVETPRYVFYDDYNVYYDLDRSVYISYARNGWTVTASVPTHLHHVDFRRAICHQVSYYDDDFVAYLGHGRPVYGGVYYTSR